MVDKPELDMEAEIDRLAKEQFMKEILGKKDQKRLDNYEKET